jgi:hypothetical protein
MPFPLRTRYTENSTPLNNMTSMMKARAKAKLDAEVGYNILKERDPKHLGFPNLALGKNRIMQLTESVWPKNTNEISRMKFQIFNTDAREGGSCKATGITETEADGTKTTTILDDTFKETTTRKHKHGKVTVTSRKSNFRPSCQ